MELKPRAEDFVYAQLLGNLLTQANHEWNRLNFFDMHPSHIIEACGVSLCGINFRLATIQCPASYFASLQEGKIDTTAVPTIKLSRPYNLWSRRDRAIAIGSLVGKGNNVVGPSFKLPK